eukprot:scaffold624_cov402-Prasinococcus_capsulatus_cf.AAC.3
MIFRGPRFWVGVILGALYLRSRRRAQLRRRCEVLEDLLMEGRLTEVWTAFKDMKEGRRKALLRSPSGELLLHLVAFKGYVEVLRLFLENEADVEARGKEGRHALHWAAFGARVTTVGALLEAGAPVNASDSYGSTALHLAASSPGFEAEHTASLLVRELLSHGAELEALDNMGRTPLCCAALTGNVHCMRALCAAGADIHCVDASGWNAAHLAVSRGHIATLRVALEWGVDPTLRDKAGRTASDIAFASGSKMTDGQLLQDYIDIEELLGTASANGGRSRTASSTRVPSAMQSGSGAPDRVGNGFTNHVAVR